MVKMKSNAIFSYKHGNSIIHKLSPTIKILLLPVFSLLVFNLNEFFTIFLVVTQIILCFNLKFSVKEQITDIKPVLFYGVMLIFAKISILIYQIIFENQNFKPLFLQIICEKETYILILKLLCIMQSTSILFKTSTPLEIREGIIIIESFLRKVFHLKKSHVLSESLALFFIFIPMIFETYENIKFTWKGRQGKTNIKMFLVIFPVLLAVTMNKAYKKTLSLLARKI